jgi:hypothetical protein
MDVMPWPAAVTARKLAYKLTSMPCKTIFTDFCTVLKVEESFFKILLIFGVNI